MSILLILTTGYLLGKIVALLLDNKALKEEMLWK